MTMGELTGKVAIVTGGASGLGKAAVERFIAEDARVVIADIDEGRGEELAAELGDTVAFQRVDVSNADDVQAAVDLAVEQFGSLDIMFNNAGVGSKFDRLIDNDLSDFDTVIGVDLKGVMLGTQRAARRMAEQGGGAIVNTASIAATTGGAGPIVYRAAKAAVVQFSKSAAIDLAPYNIRVNCIAPGHIPTGITNYDLGSVIRTMQPLQRHGSAADVAEAVLYLVSDRSAQITGIVMPIDGGTERGAAGHTAARPDARRQGRRRGTCGTGEGCGRRREMSNDIVVRGGTVVDGTGAEPFRADVAVGHDGRITEIGTDLHGERELDADGCVVSPGFIDIHTHYDAQVFWDPALRPSSSQGVTTVVAGNCGFTIAPTRAEHHDVIVRTLENVEDMDAGSLTEGIVWDFRTYPEYLELVRSRGTVLNFTAYVGHSSVRLFVMGDDAYERAATPDEIQQMCALVIEAIEAGAAGFSTSFAYTHRGMDGKPVPSRFAQPDEVEALFLAAGSTGKGVVLATAGEQCTYADMYEYQPRIGRPFTYPLFALANDRHRPQLELHEAAVARGVKVWPQVTPRPLTMQFTMDSPFSLNVSPLFGDLIDAEPAARLAAYADPEWRARATADLAEQPMAPRWETCEISESRRHTRSSRAVGSTSSRANAASHRST